MPITRSPRSFQLFHGSFSPRKAARQFPLLAGAHRAADGALLGVLIVMAIMTTMALLWQHLWTVAFTRLEKTRSLVHRLTESTAMLERHLLQQARLPRSMVPTKVHPHLLMQ